MAANVAFQKPVDRIRELAVLEKRAFYSLVKGHRRSHLNRRIMTLFEAVALEFGSLTSSKKVKRKAGQRPWRTVNLTLRNPAYHLVVREFAQAGCHNV